MPFIIVGNSIFYKKRGFGEGAAATTICSVVQ